MRYITHFTADFTAHGGAMPHHDRTSSPGGAVHDAGSDLAPDTGNGANRYPDRFTYAEPGADFLADVAAHSDGDLDATAHRVRIAAALAHPHERPHAHAGSGDADDLAHPGLTPTELDAFLDAVQRPRIIGRAAGIDVGPAPDRHPSRAQRLADLRRDLEGQYWD